MNAIVSKSMSMRDLPMMVSRFHVAMLVRSDRIVSLIQT
jgi:hypothetical protein